MTELNTIQTALANVGEILGNKHHPGLADAIARAYAKNPWFTPENTEHALKYWSEKLTALNLQQWIEKEKIQTAAVPKNIGIVAAGNIPLVGLHDVLCVLLTGNKAKVKLSSDDEELMKFFAAQLELVEPSLKGAIEFVEKLENIDAAIATGSNNTARYFEYYFAKYPHIIRKNRNSIAVLTGDESPETLARIGFDVTSYFGKGCRNITQVWAPAGYKWPGMLDNFMQYGEIINHHKYANNYTYHRALLLMNLDAHLDTGFLLLKENRKIYAPVSVLNYSHYDTLEEVKDFITENNENIQCVVSEAPGLSPTIAPGQAQNPDLWEYADGVNTVQFLMGL